MNEITQIDHAGNLTRYRERQMAEIAAYSDPPEPPKPQPKAPPAAPADPFEAKFKRAPYWKEHQSFHVTPEFRQIICRMAGVELVTPEETRLIGELGQRHKAAYDALVAVGHDAVRHKLRGLLAENEAKIKAGETPAELPHHETLDREFQQKRQQLRGEAKAVGVLAIPIFKAICQRHAMAARKVAEILDQRERQQAAEFGLPFFSSYQLCAVCWFALEGSESHVRSFTPGLAFSPNDLLNSLLSTK